MTLERYVSQLHQSAFFREFTFSHSNFKPDPDREFELADSIIKLGDSIIVFQMKERMNEVAASGQNEKWFRNKVLRKAVSQIGDSHQYLKLHSPILVKNDRGHNFSINIHSISNVINVIVYRNNQFLPEHCKRTFHYVSSQSGFIHIFELDSYIEMCNLIRVPADIISYLKYRQSMIEARSKMTVFLNEDAFLEEFISENSNALLTQFPYDNKLNINNDKEEWDLGTIIDKFHEKIVITSQPDDYYNIVAEIAKLPRSAWREFKTRFLFCIQDVRLRRFRLPYRFVYPSTGCGFIFVSCPPAEGTVNYDPARPLVALKNFTEAHKYEQKIDRCIGLVVSKDGEYFDLNWMMLDFPWIQDDEWDLILSSNAPLRQAQSERLHSFYLQFNVVPSFKDKK